MLERLRIQNFKAWRDTKDIRLAPITVFFGTNSSGKTSLHQLLVMLKQTAQSSDRQRVLHLGDQRTLIDLGTFSDVVFGHKTEATLQFELAWRRQTPLKVQDPRSEREYESDHLEFQATIAGPAKRNLQVRSMAYVLGDPKTDGFRIGMERDVNKVGKYLLTAEGYDLVYQRGRKWPLPPPYHFHGFPDEAVAYFQNTAFFADLTLDLDQLLSRIHYLGPLREYPKRLYTWSGEIPEHVGKTGGRAVEALLAASDRTISRGFRKKGEGFQALVARWLQRMGLIDSFEARPIAKQRKEYEVAVRTRAGAPEVKLTDVGFGVSQVLPVIVECFYVPERSIVIFEQPEIHLHPRVQADLADLFIEAIHAWERSRKRNVQFIVESHSEHFLRRLQRRIAEEALSSDEVALYFCEPEARGANIRELDTDVFGNIRNWPEHFFGDEIGDLAAMTEAAMQRKKREQAS